MSPQTNRREHYRQLSLVAYMVMLALLVPLTLFVVQKENDLRSHAANVQPTVTPSITSIPVGNEYR